MGILGDIAGIVGSIAGNKAQKKQNKLAEEQLDLQKEQVGKSNVSGDYLQQLADSLRKRSSGYTDTFGGGVQYNPDTGQYEIVLNPQEQAIQQASYDEEAKRNTVDQERRRVGLTDVERMREQASGEQDQALRDLDQYRSGIGQVDATKLASQLRLNRTGAVNAGYDDVAKAVGTQSLRTGTAAGDALAEIARKRTQDIAQLGDPTLDALNTAEGINSNRLNTKLGTYGAFNTVASKVDDTAFTPSGYNQQGIANKGATEATDANWQDLIGQLVSNSGSLYGSGSANLNNANKTFNTQYNPFGTAAMLKGIGNGADAVVKDVATAAAGGGGGFDFSSLFK